MEHAAKPLIYISKDEGLKVESKSFFRGNFPKLLFLILGAVILAEVVWGVRSILSSNVSKAPTVANLAEGKIILDAPKTNYQVGESIPITVRIVTGGKSTDATDLVLKYDPQFLDAASQNIKLGGIYEEYAVAEVDQSLGEVKISGITPPKGKGFSGIGELAIVDFKAKKSGKSVISVDFQKDVTFDSNIVESGTVKDILTEVYNKELFIGSEQTTTVTKISKNECQGYVQLCQKSTGQTGRQFCRLGILSSNECKFDPQLTVSCDECKTAQ